MLHFFIRSHEGRALPEKFLCRWNGNFFFILSIICTLLIIGVDRIKEFAVPVQAVIVSALYLAIGILLIPAVRFLSAFQPDIQRRDSRLNENRDRFMVSMLVMTVILALLTARAAAGILQPFDRAQAYYGEDKVVTGLVESFIPEEDSEAVFSNDYLAGISALSNPEPAYQTILLRTRDGFVSFYCKAKNLEYGDRIQVNLHFIRPSPARNPGGFDERQYYYSNGIYLKGTLVNGVEPVVISPSAGSVSRIAYAARSRILRVFIKNLPPKEAGLMAGLLLGDRSGMSKEDLECYQKAGLSHITAVSGSAITFLLIPLEAILKKVHIAKGKKTGIKFAVLIFFGFMTGWTASISRALLMVFILMAAREFHQKIKTTQSLFIAIPILLVISPPFALNIGFWLSCLATAGIVTLSRSLGQTLPCGSKDSNPIRSAFSMSIAAGVSVMPLVIWMSNEISFSSVISCIFVLPLVEFATILGSAEALAGLFNENYFLTNWIAIPLKGLLYTINRIAAGISGIGFLHLRTSGFSFYFIIAISVFVIYLFLTEKKEKRYCLYAGICILLTAGIHTGINALMTPEIGIVFVDVGQGDSTLIRLKTGESILIDAGGKAKGTEVINRMLDYYSIKYPTVYIATHTHEDHCGGMSGLIRDRGGTVLFVPWGTIEQVEKKKTAKDAANAGESPVISAPVTGETDMGEELLSAAREAEMEVKEIGQGDVITIRENLKLTIYNPEKTNATSGISSAKAENPSDPFLSGNASSLVIKLDTPFKKVLVMGDATGEAEQNLVDNRQDLTADIYRISHHGSPSSTNHDIINAVSPRLSVISVGKNFYGHPSPKVIQRLEAAGSKIYRTDENGAILIGIDKEKLIIQAMIP